MTYRFAKSLSSSLPRPMQPPPPDLPTRFTPYFSPFTDHPNLRSCVEPSHPSPSSSISSSSASFPSELDLKPLLMSGFKTADPKRKICHFEIPGGGSCRDDLCEDLHLRDVEPSGKHFHCPILPLSLVSCCCASGVHLPPPLALLRFVFALPSHHHVLLREPEFPPLLIIDEDTARYLVSVIPPPYSFTEDEIKRALKAAHAIAGKKVNPAKPQQLQQLDFGARVGVAVGILIQGHS